MKQIKNPHDYFFKSLFKDTNTLKDFLPLVLEKEIVSNIEQNSLKIIDNEKNKKYKKFYLDLIAEAKIKNKKTHIYFLFEHKSYPDKMLMIQILNYCLSIWEENIKNKSPLTPIIPIVFYHGKENFEIKENFIDNFDVEDFLKKYLLNFKITQIAS